VPSHIRLKRLDLRACASKVELLAERRARNARPVDVWERVGTGWRALCGGKYWIRLDFQMLTRLFH
jgi:hypothetical protein